MAKQKTQQFEIRDPLVIMFVQDERIITHLHPPADYTHEHYGMVVCDLVRHVAKAFDVDEQDVWEWVEQERQKPTTDITQHS